MGVVNTLGANITKLDSTPLVPVPNNIMDAAVYVQVDTVSVAAADSDTSTYRMARLHSSDVPVHIWLYNDSVPGGTDYDLGGYDCARLGGAVIDVNNIATTIDMSVAHTTSPLDLLHKTNDIVQTQYPLWQILGLSADPQKEIDLVLTANTVGTAQGDITLVVEYTKGH